MSAKLIAPPNPLRGLTGGDGDYLRRVIDEIDGPVLLVGHSYGGSVITAAGTADSMARPPGLGCAPDRGPVYRSRCPSLQLRADERADH